MPRKLSFTFHFWHKSYPWWCETCRVIQQQCLMKQCDFFLGGEWGMGWSKHTLTPPTYFQKSRPPDSSMIHARARRRCYLSDLRKWRISARWATRGRPDMLFVRRPTLDTSSRLDVAGFVPIDQSKWFSLPRQRLSAGSCARRDRLQPGAVKLIKWQIWLLDRSISCPSVLPAVRYIDPAVCVIDGSMSCVSRRLTWSFAMLWY